MIISFGELNKIREKHPHEKIVFCGGAFDLLHQGHIQHLKNVKEMGDILVVAISSDKRVRERKGKERPIHNQETRVIMMDVIRHVDYALISPEPDENFPDTPPTIRILEKLMPNIYVSNDSRWLDHEERINNLGISLVIGRENKIDSTTNVIKRIKERFTDES
ncbi:MAG: adenylyltransferase/cytidyltransferase family protein [bacterium]|nr:adenylyltransferase/cytidyltransferase family protein [bacterium]